MAIKFIENTRTFYLEGKSTTYAFYVNDIGYLEHLYYGERIGLDDLKIQRCYGTYWATIGAPGFDYAPGDFTSYQDVPPEIAFFGIGDYREPTVHIENTTGDRISELLYKGHEILAEKPKMQGMPSMDGGETLVVHLMDDVNGFGADLYYTVYDDCDVIARRIVYKNGDKKTILRRAYSFTFALPTNDYEVMKLYGGWARERRIDRQMLHRGMVTIDSKRGSSSAMMNPFMAVMTPNSTETYGEVYGFSLIYSSSFVLKAQANEDGSTCVMGGINDFDFSWELAPGEEFETPEVAIAFSNEGIGGMSRNFHDAFRNHLINKRFVREQRPLLINNWEGTYFDFNNEKLMAIADAVDGTGIDTFVLDDGWFGARVDNDNAGLGDWVVNTDKLQGGLKRLTDHLRSKGMTFGLWFEPEMVNEDSDLFRAHPDYAIGAPDRMPCFSRHQRVLDITRKEVRDYIVESVNKVLSENDIGYVKWDCNRNLSEYYSFGREPSRQAEFAHRYALGLYDLCERIIEANPHIFFEGCSGGGGRFDPAMLHYFPQIWTSDDTDANERTSIQYGTSIVYPMSSMSAHVSMCPNHQTGRTTSFETRAAIAHLGPTGYELDTTVFTDEDLEQVKAQVKEYRRCADLILNGDLYRIENPMESNFFTEVVISKDKNEGFLISYRRLGGVNNEVKRIRFAGLDKDKQYYVEELDMTLSGSTLMNVGIAPKYPQGDFMTVKYHFTAK